jgi:alanine dehydrogenase
VASNQHLAAGVNTWQGQLCCQPVAEAFDIEYQPLPQLLRC